MSREPNRVVYDVGHNEQMQLGICVSTIAEVLRGGDLSDAAESLTNLDLDVLADFEGIFNLPGVIQITKKEIEL